MNYRILFLFVIIVRGQYSGELLGLLSEYENCYAVQETYVIFWTVDNSSSYVDFALVGNTTGYVAIGFNRLDQAYMTNSDVILGWVNDNGTVFADDFWINDLRAICVPSEGGVCRDTDIGGTRDISEVSGSFIEDVTTIKFRKPFITDDMAHDVEIGNDSIEYGKIWSMASFDYVAQHNLGNNIWSMKVQETPTCPTSNSEECSGNGNCTKGCCVCYTGFALRDCSLNLQVPSSLSPNIVPSDYQYSSVLDPNYQLFWNIYESSETIEIAVQVQATGWVGFGPTNSEGMLNSDVIIASVDGDIVSITDSKIDARSVTCDPVSGGVCPDTNPQIGGTNNILEYNGNINGSVTQVKWLRKFNTGDIKGDIVITQGKMYAIWAYHPTSKALVEHLFNTKGVIEINFFNGEVILVEDLRPIHGTIMFLVWGVLIPFGTFIARFFKQYNWWFNVHRIVNGTAMVAMIAAFVIAIFMATSQFNLPHSIIGLTVVILGLSQPITGIISDKMFNKHRTYTPIFPDMIHWIIGWGTLLLAMINILLGLILYDYQPATNAYSIYFAVVVSFFVGYILYKAISKKYFSL